MSFLLEQIKDDAALVVDPDGFFSEQVIYTPSRLKASKGSTSRTIYALIVRDPPAPLNATPGDVMPKMLASVLNNSVTGISSSELDTGGDTITVAYRIGTTPVAYRVSLAKGYESNDPGMMTLELN